MNTESSVAETPSTEPISETTTSDFLELDHSNLDLGYKSCKESAKQFFGSFFWMISNTSGDERKGLHAWMAYLARVSNFLDMFSADGLSSEAWEKFRAEVTLALDGQCRSPQLAALCDTVQRFKIPPKFVLDPLDAADIWMKTDRLKTQAEFDQFTSLMGGSALAATLPIFEIHENADVWQPMAIHGGQAIYQTLLLSLFAHDARQDQVFFPQDSIKACQVDLEKVKAGEGDKSFRHFCRLQVSQIEPHLREAGTLTYKLELDGQRVYKSLLAWAWETLMRIKHDPELMLQPEGPLSKREKFMLKTKHWMGLEGRGVAIIPEDHGHEH